MNGSNDKRYRFAPKRYGWGFVPISWEGRLCTVCLVGLVLLAGWRNGFFEGTGMEPTLMQTGSYILDLFLIIFASLWFMDTKTNGSLKRRWGDKD